MAWRLACSITAALLMFVWSATVAAQMPGATGIITIDGVLAGSVRTTDRTLVRVLVDTYDSSPTFRSIVDQLNTSDVIVYVVRGQCGSSSPSCLRLAGRFGRQRYVHALVDAPPTLRRAGPLIAHELLHAVEIASAPEVADAGGLLELYRALSSSWVACQTRFETEQARRVELTVVEELNNFAGSEHRRGLITQK